MSGEPIVEETGNGKTLFRYGDNGDAVYLPEEGERFFEQVTESFRELHGADGRVKGYASEGRLAKFSKSLDMIITLNDFFVSRGAGLIGLPEYINHFATACVTAHLTGEDPNVDEALAFAQKYGL